MSISLLDSEAKDVPARPVPVAELQPLLNLQSQERDIDLLKALEAKGDYLWQVVDGRFVAKRDPSKFSTAGVPRQPPAPKALSGGGQSKPTEESGRLYYAVQEFDADTGFVRADIGVVNKGPRPSDPSEMVCQFTDGFGKPYAEDRRVTPAMKPGESEVDEIFSLVKTEDTSMKPTRENVTCYFLSQTNPSSNPKTRSEWPVSRVTHGYYPAGYPNSLRTQNSGRAASET